MDCIEKVSSPPVGRLEVSGCGSVWGVAGEAVESGTGSEDGGGVLEGYGEVEGDCSFWAWTDGEDLCS